MNKNNVPKIFPSLVSSLRRTVSVVVACLVMSAPQIAGAAEDYGDAPASFGDASHVIDSSLYLGDTPPDAESGSQYSHNAYGDGDEINDGSGTWYMSGDEDGAPRQPVNDYIPLFPVLKMTAMTYSADFKVNNAKAVAATLYGWIDFDHDGVFSTDEAASVSVPASSFNGTATLNWDVPVDIELGTTFIRLRLTTDSSVTTATPSSVASDGEVEDFALAVALDIPPDSDAISITTGATPLACQSVVFSDDFDDLAIGQFIGPHRGGATYTLRDWVVSGGGSDTYARTDDGTGMGLGTSIYLGNGSVRRVSPKIVSGLEFDADGRMTTPLDAVELRDDVDDRTPGVTLASYGSDSDWGPEPVTFSRSFATEVGKSYRLYFKALPEDVGGSFVAGTMRLDLPGGSIHFKIPSSSEGTLDYAVEFTALDTTSTINFVNYGHILSGGGAGWCDPASEYINNPWCTVGGGDGAGNELIIDNVAVTESVCAQSGSISGVVYVDDDSNDSYASASDTELPSVAVSLFNEANSVLVSTTNTAANGSYSFINLDTSLVYRVEVDTADGDLPAGATPGTINPLTGVAVTAGNTTADQNFGFDIGVIPPSVHTAVGEYRFDDCAGDGSWNIDSSGNNNTVAGSAEVISDDFKNYGCTSVKNSSWNMEVPHISDYEVDNGAVSLLIYDHHNVWTNTRLLDKGWSASKRLNIMGTKAGGNNLAGTVVVDLNGNSIATDEVYFTTRNDGTDDDTQWTHVMLTFGSNGMKLYINGVLKGTNSYTGGISQVQGAFRLPGMSGYFDEFYIFDEQVDATGVQGIYNNLVANKNLDGSNRTCACGSNPTGEISGKVYIDDNGNDQYDVVGSNGVNGLQSDLLLLYRFGAGSGNTVYDISGVGSPMDLTIADPSRVTWMSGGGLSVDNSTSLKAATDTKLTAALTASNEVTVEAWIKPDNLTQDGPARIVTLSKNTGERNLTLGQEDDDYNARLRTSTNSNNGNSPATTATGVVETVLQHVVYTRTAAGAARIYVDGVSVGSETVGGNLSNFDNSYLFALANELTGSRSWLGDFYKVALYKRALDASEVSSLFAEGATGGGEPLLSDVTVSLYNDNGTGSTTADDIFLESAGTATDGAYRFSGVATELTYRIEVNTADTDLPASANIGTTNPLTGVSVAPGTPTSDKNFGFDVSGGQPAAISGTVYTDSNSNDTYDAGTESGVGAITVSLFNHANGAAIDTTSTAANGAYSFSDLNAALTYRIEVDTADVDLAGKISGTTNPLTGVAVIAGNTTTDQNFGFDAGGTPGVYTTVGEYRFDDCAGAEWLNDYSINANTATGTKRVVSDDAKNYACTSLSAYSSAVEVPHIPDYAMTEGAVSMLVYDHHNVWATSRLLEKTDAISSDRFDLTMKRANGDLYQGTFSVNLNGNSIDTGETFFNVTASNDGDFDTDWVHVMFTFGPQGMRLYVDGQLKGTNAYTGGFSNLDSAFKLPYFSGLYDEFYILKGQPSNAQVQTLHANLLANKNIDGSDRTCDCSYPFAAINGKVYLDENGNNQHDLLTGNNAGSLQSDLLLLYRFGTGSGNTVFDISGVGSPMDLTITDPSRVTWIPDGGLSIDNSTLLQAAPNNTKLNTALQASNEVTVEAWIKPDNLTQDGPARIVTLSESTINRNLTLGQEDDGYSARLRTSTNSNNGNSPETTATGVVETVLQHVVYTRNAAGAARIYVDGVLVGSETIDGNLSNFNNSYLFALANELTGSRAWLGDFYKVALYQRALSASEVSGLFAEGTVSGEPLLPNITVSLYNDNGTSSTTADDIFLESASTGIDGGYEFDSVPTGLTYRVEVDTADTDLPAGANIGTTNPLTGVSVVSGTAISDQNFGFDSPDLGEGDYSDAPASYGDATHSIISNIQLGAAIDSESASLASILADGDGSDDDGIIFPALVQGDSTFISATVSGSGGYLQGWIDWNGDGDFADSGEQISTDLQLSSGTSGTISVPVTVPSAIVSQTFARFRWSTTPGLNSTAAASDGEVEDYAVTVKQVAGDPDDLDDDNDGILDVLECTGSGGSGSYSCATAIASISGAFGSSSSGSNMAASCGAGGGLSSGDLLRYQISANSNTFSGNTNIELYERDASGNHILASTIPYEDFNGPRGYYHHVIQNNGVDSIRLSWSSTGTGSYNIGYCQTACVICEDTDGDSVPDYLDTDSDNDGCPDAIEGDANFEAGDLDNAWQLTGGFDANGVPLVAGADGQAVGSSRDGNIKPSTCGVIDYDYSDAPADGSAAPDGSNNTAYGVARHKLINPSLKLGATVTAENSAVQDADNASDDGISVFPTLTEGDSDYTIPAANISGSGSGTLHAWIDFDGNGSFDTSEYTWTELNAGNAGDLIWSGQAAMSGGGATWARFRLASDALTDDGGTTIDERAFGYSLVDGEVEDYSLTINGTGGGACFAQGGTLGATNYFTELDNGTMGFGSGAADEALAGNPYPGEIANGTYDAYYSMYWGEYSFVSNAQTPRNDAQHGSLVDPVYGANGRFFAADPDNQAPFVSTSLSGLNAGTSYQVGFYVANSEHSTSTPNNEISILIDGTEVYTTGELLPSTPMQWEYHTFVYHAGAATSLDFDLRAQQTGNDGNDYLLDNITVNECQGVSGSISGTVYTDSNSNNAYDSGSESGIGSVTVSLLSDVDGSAIATTGTVADGSYSFNGLDPALTYRIEVDTADTDLVGKTIGTTNPLTGVVVTAGNTTADQNFGFDDGGTPFSCTGGMYQVYDTDGKFASIDVVNGGFTPISTIGYSINAIGYRSANNFIYGIQRNSHQLLRIDATGEAVVLGTVSGLPAPAVSYIIGDFAGDGLLHVADYTGTDIHRINVDTLTVESSYTITGPASGINLADFAYNPTDGLLYGLAANNLYSVNPATGVSQNVGATGLVDPLQFGAAYADVTGRLFFGNNETGAVYEASGINPTVSQVATAGVAIRNDGASCVLANSPISPPHDYSDAPADGTTAPDGISTTSYGVAVHEFDSHAGKLGATITSETSAVPGADNASDDGVTLPTLTAGQSATISLSVSGNAEANLWAWVDWNGDGDFADTNEQIADSIADNFGGDTNPANGVVEFTINVPAGAITTAPTYARFRWSYFGVSSPIGTVTDGEVEDYVVLVEGDTEVLPLTCNASIYIGSSTSETIPSQFYSVDTVSSPFALNTIGNNAHGHSYNAMGYREQDNYIYAIKQSSSNLLRIGSGGSILDLGAVTGLPVPANIWQTYDSGDVFPDGYLYIHEVTSHPELYKIDVTTTPPSLVETINLSESIWLSDFAYNKIDNKVYGMGDQGEKFMIDPATWTVSTVGSNAPAASYGAAYTDNAGSVYIYKNNPGTFYQVDFGLNGTGTGVMTELSTAPNVSFNDGASCRAEPPVGGCSLVVTTTDDIDSTSNDSGSLRDAIECANSNPGPDTISFNMSTTEVGYDAGTDVWTITPTSVLPTLTGDGTTIDGETQTGAACGSATDIAGAITGRALKVQLEGAGLSGSEDGLTIGSAADITVKGLAIGGFPRDGLVANGSTNTTVICNHIGLAADGVTALANNDDGLVFNDVTSGDIGNGMISGMNVVGTNVHDGIRLEGTVDDVIIDRNYIGIAVDGNTPVGNGRGYTGAGVSFAYNTGNIVSDGEIIRNNVIASNGAEIWSFYGAANNVLIENNLIGTDATGLLDRSDQWYLIIAEDNDGWIMRGNVISGSDQGSGIEFYDMNSSIIQGNKIGVGIDGTTPLGNGFWGVRLSGGNNNLVGGSGADEGNIIAYNSTDGTNGYAGVLVQSGGDARIIGNVIHSNDSGGIEVVSATSSAFISQNSIYGNTDIGIDLGGNGVTANDNGDGDTGPNDLLNFPELKQISYTGTTVTYDFDLDVPVGNYTVEFFDNPSGLDSSGYGEGEVYLGTINITHSGAGSQNFNGSFNATQAPSSEDSVVTTATLDSAGITSEFSAQALGSCTLVVTTSNDIDSANNNSGSLRDAIECANETEGADTITFNIPTTESGYMNPDNVPGNADDYWSIQPTSRLPFITDSLVIAGDTQPGYADKPIIELEGSVAGSVEGLFLDTGSDGSTLRALIVNRFDLSGIELRDSSNHTVVGSYIGTDSSGLLEYGNNDHGIEIADGSGNNTIGGVNELDGNIISGNRDSGIRIDGSGANIIQGNLIGLGSDGQTAMGNVNHGLYIRASGNQIGGSTGSARNVIADSDYNGIELFEGTANVIEGNYIGTDITGTLDRGNHIYGIKLTNADGNTIGGSGDGTGNLISGNGHDGIMIQSSDSNTVQGNYIGTDVTGTLGLGNTGVGITLRDGESNQIGGPASGAGNVISANGDRGVWVRDNTSQLNQILGNVIGANVTVDAALGNGSHGVDILSAVDTEVAQNTIAYNGGSGAMLSYEAEDNRLLSNNIRDNQQYGVLLESDAVSNQIVENTISDNGYAGIANDADSNNTFSRNSISSNGALGIDLGLDGVTENSNVDSWLNYPEIGSESSVSTNGTMIVAYDFDLDVPANTHGYRVEFFSNTVVDPSGHGEGETYLGYVDIDHEGTGSENFKGSLNANQTVPENANIALTLTEKLDATTLGSTSEFSRIRNGGLSVCTDLLADPDAEMVDIVLNENSSEIVYLEALDAAGNPVTYAISGGADGNRFVIDPVAPGALFDCVTIRFINNPIVDNRALPVVKAGSSQQPLPGNYEAPVDSGNDNVYDLEITVTDSEGNTVTKPLSVIIQNVNEKPVVTSAALVDFLERQDASTVVMDLESYDPDADDAEGSGVTYSISGGTDGLRFNVDTQSGELRFVDSPDYGAPADSNGDNVYELDVRVTDDQGYASRKSLAVTVTDDPDQNGVRVAIKALLQGPYDWSAGLMSDNLRSLELLPLNQPYTPEPFNYQGTEVLGSASIELTGDEAIVDWVLIELRHSADPTQVVAASAAPLRRNGDVADVSLEGSGLTFDNVAAGQYYVSLRHRNHLGVMTATPLALSMESVLVDFSSADTPVYGEHARLVDGDLATLWSGDVNQDNRLILNGQGSDINPVLTAVLMAPGNSGFNSSYQLSGYNATDLNMDGKTVFMGPSNDANILLGNTLLHPGNPNFSGNYIAVGSMP